MGNNNTHDQYMQRALLLASKALGRTSPNPAVGAVLVQDGHIVGEGATQPPGSWHAERVALHQAGTAARGATLYVTLEPCCHYGRTPPCTDALIEAGVAHVYAAIRDPNPRVAGNGLQQLQAAGIETHVGIGAAEATALNEAWLTYIHTGRPFVVAKYAMTLDGKIATAIGDARWVTGSQARTYVHKLRDRLDAIMVGVNTIIHDDPQLTTRLDQPDVHHPIRIIVDSRGRVPLTAQVVSGELPGTTLVATTAQMPAHISATLQRTGVEVAVLPERYGRVDLHTLMDMLAQRQITSVLVEGGSTLLGSLVEAELIHKVLAFVAPKLVGGQSAPTPLGGTGIQLMSDARELTDVQLTYLHPDVLISGYLRKVV